MIIIFLYVIFGLISSFSLLTYGHYKSWDEALMIPAVVLGGIFWPAILPVILLVIAGVWFNEAAEAAANRIRSNRR